MNNFAILSPGQGGQSETMFNLAFQDPLLKTKVLGWINDAGVDLPLETILADKSLLFSNQLAQPLIAACSLANWTALLTRLPHFTPSSVLGYSIGEVSAYGIAGMLSPSNAVNLAFLRAKAMNFKKNETEGLMAVTRVYFDISSDFLEKHKIAIAIDNKPTSLILGGLTSDLQSAAKELREKGAIVQFLPVHVASHTPMMQNAVKPFEKILENFKFISGTCPVLSGISAEFITNEKLAKEQLVLQLTHTIRWSMCLDMLAESGIKAVLEIGPGSALSRMVKERYSHIASRSVNDFRGFDAVAKWVLSPN